MFHYATEEKQELEMEYGLGFADICVIFPVFRKTTQINFVIIFTLECKEVYAAILPNFYYQKT